MKLPRKWSFRETRCPIDGYRLRVMAYPEAGRKGLAITVTLVMAPATWAHMKAHRRMLAPTVTDQYRARQVARRRRGRRR